MNLRSNSNYRLATSAPQALYESEIDEILLKIPDSAHVGSAELGEGAWNAIA